MKEVSFFHFVPRKEKKTNSQELKTRRKKNLILLLFLVLLFLLRLHSPRRSAGSAASGPGAAPYARGSRRSRPASGTGTA